MASVHVISSDELPSEIKFFYLRDGTKNKITRVTVIQGSPHNRYKVWFGNRGASWNFDGTNWCWEVFYE